MHVSRNNAHSGLSAPGYVYFEEGLLLSGIMKKEKNKGYLGREAVKYQLQYLINYIYPQITDTCITDAFDSILSALESGKASSGRGKIPAFYGFQDLCDNISCVLDALLDRRIVLASVETAEIKRTVQLFEIIFEAGISDDYVYILAGHDKKAASGLFSKIKGIMA